MLETSLMNWIKSMGVLHKLGKPNAHMIETLIELQSEICNGSLLCEIVMTIFNIKIIGIFRDPRTESTCISNIRKALDIVRR